MENLTKEEFAKMMGDPNLINPTIKAIWMCLEKAGYEIVKKGVVMQGSALQYNVIDSRGDMYMDHSIRMAVDRIFPDRKRICDINNQECLTSGRCTGEC